MQKKSNDFMAEKMCIGYRRKKGVINEKQQYTR